MAQGELKALFLRKQEELRVNNNTADGRAAQFRMEQMFTVIEKEAENIEESIKTRILQGATNYKTELGQYREIDVNLLQDVFAKNASFQRIQRVCDDNDMSVRIVESKVSGRTRYMPKETSVKLEIEF